MSLLHAHVVFVTKFRRRLFIDQMLVFCEHTWLSTTLMAGDIRVFELVDPALTAQITVATNSAEPGSPIARAFSACAQKLSLNEFFDARLLGITRRR